MFKLLLCNDLFQVYILSFLSHFKPLRKVCLANRNILKFFSFKFYTRMQACLVSCPVDIDFCFLSFVFWL